MVIIITIIIINQEIKRGWDKHERNLERDMCHVVKGKNNNNNNNLPKLDN